MREGRVLVREAGRRSGIPGRDVTEHVSADQCPYPLPVGVAIGRRGGRCQAEDKVAVSDSFGRVDHGEGEGQEPFGPTSALVNAGPYFSNMRRASIV